MKKAALPSSRKLTCLQEDIKFQERQKTGNKLDCIWQLVAQYSNVTVQDQLNLGAGRK